MSLIREAIVWTLAGLGLMSIAAACVFVGLALMAGAIDEAGRDDGDLWM